MPSSLAYLTKENRLMLNVFKVTVALMVFIGPLAENLLVWNLGDLFVILMAFVNLYAIVRLFPVAKETLDDFTQQLKLGKDPEFKRDRIKNGISLFGKVSNI